MAVDAVAQARRRRAVRKDVAEMAVAARAADLDAAHAVRAILELDHGLWRGRLEIARPAAAAVEFAVGAKEFGSAADARIGARGLGVPKRPGEGTLRTLFARDAILLRCQQGSPLRFCPDDFSLGHAGLHRFSGAPRRLLCQSWPFQLRSRRRGALGESRPPCRRTPSLVGEVRRQLVSFPQYSFAGRAAQTLKWARFDAGTIALAITLFSVRRVVCAVDRDPEASLVPITPNLFTAEDFSKSFGNRSVRARLCLHQCLVVGHQRWQVLDSME